MVRLLQAMTLAGAVPVAVTAAAGQCVPAWAAAGLDLAGTDGTAWHAIAWDPDGAGPLAERLVVAGDFNVAGTAFAPGLAAWDGQDWQPMQSPGFSITALGVRTSSGGELVAAGSNPARVSAWTGNAWVDLATGVDGGISALVEYGGELYAAGSFSGLGGALGRVVRLTKDGWTAVPGVFTGANVPGHMAVVGGRLAISGGGGELNFWDGSSVQHHMTQAPTIRTLAEHNGELFAGCYTSTTHPVLRWMGSEWFPYGTNIGWTTHALVLSLASYGGELYAAGEFSVWFGAAQGKNLARYRNGGWEALGPSAQFLAAFDGGLAAVGFSGQAAGNAATWDGQSWQALARSPAIGRDNGAWPQIMDVQRFDDAVWICGDLTMLDSAGAAGEGAALFRQGAWTVLSGSPESIHPESIAMFGGQVHVSGRAKASWAPMVYRHDGSSWLPVGNLMTYSAGYGASLAAGNGVLYAAGRMGLGSQVISVARWDGQNWSVVGQPPGTVLDLAVIDGSLYICGRTSAWVTGFVARHQGGSWVPVGSEFNGLVQTVGVFDGGAGPELIAGGQFTSVGGLAAARIARWDGTAWRPMGEGVPDRIYAIQQVDGLLLAGGSIYSLGGPWPLWLRAWDGHSWTDMTPPGVKGSVRAILPSETGALIGGTFITVGNLVSPGLAHVALPCYANCDCSAAAPVLNVADFGCFLQKFAAGDAYANCDGSTAPPVLNVADFGCFLQRFAAGCP